MDINVADGKHALCNVSPAKRIEENSILIPSPQVQIDVNSRLRKLRDEISRVRANERLEEVEKLRITSEKYAVIMKPPIVQLERLLAITSVPPQTPHETEFQKNFLNRTHF